MPHFIVFEGGEGSGKTTQLRILAQRLSEQGHRVRCTREPGGSPGAEELRSIILSGDSQRWTPMTEVLLFAAARADHAKNTIDPALESGMVVLCDRYVGSTRAYQGAGHSVDDDAIQAIHEASGVRDPDCVIWLDIPPGESCQRAAKRASESGADVDRFERLNAAFHKRVYEHFSGQCRNDPQWCRIDARGSAEAVAERIGTAIAQRFPDLYGAGCMDAPDGADAPWGGEAMTP